MERRLITAVAALLLLLPGAVFAQAYVPTPVTVSTEKVKMNGSLYYSHVVLERQTLWSIAKAYGVSVNDIVGANAGLSADGTGLQKNAIILIPVRGEGEPAVVEQAPPEEQDVKLPAYREHIVKWYEDLDDIAALYGVSAKEIMDYNGMSSKKVERRQVLKIPVKGSEAPVSDVAEHAAPVVEPDPVVVETPAIQEDTVRTEAPDFLPADYSGKSTVTFSLLLPFNAASRSRGMNMDFYAGALLAVKDLEAAGISTVVNVYDIAGDVYPDSYQLQGQDFILGPVKNSELEKVIGLTDGAVTVISPLEPKADSLLAVHSNFIQARTPQIDQYADIAAWIASEYSPSDKVILLTEKAPKHNIAEELAAALDEAGVPYTRVAHSMIEGRSVPATVTQHITKSSLGRIIIASEREAFVADVIRTLGILSGKGYPVTAYALSKVRSFDTVDLESLHKAETHVSSSSYIDYSSKDVAKFVKAFRALYKGEPSRFAFQGYDATMYFVSMCARYGDRWKEYLPSAEKVKLLQSDFLMEQCENGSLVNSAVRRSIYKSDLTTVAAE
ncbi:MAG: LysM peptidoglycan-binding domain-containing protein [Bacteroidales bacterium]|nr:LysM peptidoglycan-binding domain-containing protein [Bacteroidales bacterium]